MKTSITVCDVCKDRNRPTKEYTVSDAEGRTGRTDRCTEDAAALEEVLPPAPKGRGGRPRTPVVSMNDVERAKRQK